MSYRKSKTEKGATVITAQTEINAEKDKVWNVLRSIGEIKNFHPLIKNSYSSTSQQNGLGAKRICELIPMGQMVEEVVEWNEGHSFVMQVIGGKMLPPYRYMRGEINLTEQNGKTKVTFSFSYRLKFGFLGQIMNALIIKPQFKNAPPKYVNGLKEYVESLGQ